MRESPSPKPSSHGDRRPPGRWPPTALAAPEAEDPNHGYWEVWPHPGLPAQTLPRHVPELLVREYAGRRGMYRLVLPTD
jgi:hypothetical protein